MFCYFKYTCKEIIKYFLKMLQILLKSREISRSRSGPFSLACTDPYTCIGWEDQSIYRGKRFGNQLTDHFVTSPVIGHFSNNGFRAQ